MARLIQMPTWNPILRK